MLCLLLGLLLYYLATQHNLQASSMTRVMTSTSPLSFCFEQHSDSPYDVSLLMRYTRACPTMDTSSSDEI